jgi:multisubunit Na+/H+ antiporter MnhC subunit
LADAQGSGLNLRPFAADGSGVSVNDLVLVQGMRDTKRALARWNRDPGTVLWPWLWLSMAIAVALLGATWLVAKLSTPDGIVYVIPGLNAPAGVEDYAHVLFRNSLVLALHALACVAGFIAGSSLPLSAANRSGFSRWVHEQAGPFAIAFVLCATLFSLATQAFVLGGTASSIADYLDVTPGVLMLTLSVHALPELTALFLPLAAWIVASRNDDWQDLLAATAVTVAIAVPVLLAAAAVEVWVTPHLLADVSGRP